MELLKSLIESGAITLDDIKLYLGSLHLDVIGDRDYDE